MTRPKFIPPLSEGNREISHKGDPSNANDLPASQNSKAGGSGGDHDDRSRTRSPWMLGLLILLAIVSLGIYQAFDQGEFEPDVLEVQGPRIGQPAPDFTLTTFDGERFTLSEHRGKTIVLNFWGSWCLPCREEMPALQQAWERSDDSVMFVGIGSKRDRESQAMDFAKEFGVTYPIGRDSEGGTVAAGKISKAYQVNVFPSTFFIAPDGTVSAIILQELSTEDLDYYIEQARHQMIFTEALATRGRYPADPRSAALPVPITQTAN